MNAPAPAAKTSAPTSRIATAAWVISNRLTHQLAIWCGNALPLLIVAEHPRSGGTWLAHMLADYMQIPFPKYRPFPTTFEAVVHTHLRYSPRMRRAVFIQRDGRDLVVSTYFYAVKRLQTMPLGNSRRKVLLRRYPSLEGATFDRDDVRQRMPQFIEEWWRRPFGCRTDWETYSGEWRSGSRHVALTSYESLRNDCVSQLTRIIARLSTKPIDHARLADVVAKNSFEAQTGRQPGEDDARSNKRKGIVGDWKNYFIRDAAVTFQKLGGRALIEMGYEADNSWVDAVS